MDEMKHKYIVERKSIPVMPFQSKGSPAKFNRCLLFNSPWELQKIECHEVPYIYILIFLRATKDLT
jgi:hypothetical protein